MRWMMYTYLILILEDFAIAVFTARQQEFFVEVNFLKLNKNNLSQKLRSHVENSGLDV